MDGWRRVPVGDGAVELEVTGHGEPVLVIQTALTADELRPLSRLIAETGDHRVFHYHRRGYAGSDPAGGPGSIEADAEDAAALVRSAVAGPAHVVGASYSAAVALRLASSSPGLVRSLTVLEAPPAGTPGAPGFREANLRLLADHESSGPLAALDGFMTMLAGADWRETSERDLPGSVAAMERDAATFFERDVPALVSWRFDDQDAQRIRCPVLSVGGSESGPWFSEMRTRLVRLLPAATDVTVVGAGHLLASTHPRDVADLVCEHLRRHAGDVAP